MIRTAEAWSGMAVTGLACLLLMSCSRRGGGQSLARERPPLVVSGLSTDDSLTSERMLAEFTRETGIPVRLVPGAESPVQQLNEDEAMLAEHAAVPDVYALDVTWAARLAGGLLDLRSRAGVNASAFLPELVRNESPDHRLIAEPLTAGAGMLYYRTDLLRKYGYRRPPRTWQELQQMAGVIQRGERASGHPEFWGYVWEGAPGEILTCNALEWQVSWGGGDILEANRTVSVDNAQTIHALEMARSWIGTISPPGVIAYDEEDARNLWETGNAAFMRNWPYAWAHSESAESAVRGKFDVTVLPSGGSRHADVVGGWSLGISRYSRHPGEAEQFIAFMTSAAMEKARIEELSELPTRTQFYREDSGSDGSFLSHFRDSMLEDAVNRPVAVSGSRYAEVSAAYFEAVHKVLTGAESASLAMSRLQGELMRITGYPAGKPAAGAGGNGMQGRGN